MSHTTYGLAMADGLWQASCACGWRSDRSPDFAEQTDELDRHLRVVVVSGQRRGRVSRAATGTLLQVVDHTVTAGMLVVGLLVAGPVVAKVGRAA